MQRCFQALSFSTHNLGNAFWVFPAVWNWTGPKRKQMNGKRTGILKKHIKWISLMSLAGSQMQSSAWHWRLSEMFSLSFILYCHKKYLTHLSHKAVYLYNKRLNRSPEDLKGLLFLSNTLHFSPLLAHTLSYTVYTQTQINLIKNNLNICKSSCSL